MTTSDEELRELAGLEGGTPGPWGSTNGYTVHGADCIVSYVGACELRERYSDETRERWVQDAALIAEAWRVRELAQEVLDLREALERSGHHAYCAVYQQLDAACDCGQQALKRGEEVGDA